MLNSNSTPVTTTTSLDSSKNKGLQEYSTLELAQALAHRLAISERDWHRLKSNRQVRALELTAVALVFLVKDKPADAIARLKQATSWLDRSISAPPCPTHGSQKEQ